MSRWTLMSVLGLLAAVLMFSAWWMERGRQVARDVVHLQAGPNGEWRYEFDGPLGEIRLYRHDELQQTLAADERYMARWIEMLSDAPPGR